MSTAHIIPIVSDFDHYNKQTHTSFTVHTVRTVVRKTMQLTQSNTWHNATGGHNRLRYVQLLHVIVQTRIHTILMTATVCEYYYY